MLTNLRREIRRMPWWAQLVAWPLYFALWIIGQILSGIWWLLTEAYGQTTTALGRLIRPILLPGLLILGAVLLYAIAPRAFSGVLNLALVVAVLWFGVNVMFSGFRKPKKKKSEH